MHVCATSRAHAHAALLTGHCQHHALPATRVMTDGVCMHHCMATGVPHTWRATATPRTAALPMLRATPADLLRFASPDSPGVSSAPGMRVTLTLMVDGTGPAALAPWFTLTPTAIAEADGSQRNREGIGTTRTAPPHVIPERTLTTKLIAADLRTVMASGEHLTLTFAAASKQQQRCLVPPALTPSSRPS